MKIVIVGSISFIEQMRAARSELVKMGREVILPPSAELDQTKEYWSEVKKKNIDEFLRVGRERNLKHFNFIKNADAILVVNFPKHGINGYIGANTLMEIAVAFEHGKRIFILNDPSENTFASEELEYMEPVIINSDLTKIK
jgi:DNA-binding LacI/PurR family transcriptional regulator